MSLVTIAQFKEHFETDLVGTALQELLDDAEAEIDKRHGQLATGVDTFENVELATALFLSRQAKLVGGITTVTEEIRLGDGSYQTTVLAADDYQQRYEGRQIERLSTGTNPRRTWGNTVTVVYVPNDDTIRRTRVIIDLVKLAIQYNAMKSEAVGDYKSQSLGYDKERARILATLEDWPFA